MALGRGAFPQISTPYDELFPSVEDASSRFYLEAIRLYLGLCAGTVTLEDAMRFVERLKENPEFAKSPCDPTLVPVNEHFETKIVENLKTLKKYNLHTPDSIKSAYSFAFLVEEAPMNEKDFMVLSHLVRSPLAPANKIAESLGIAPKTVVRSIARLRKDHTVRFSCLSDNSAFGVQSVILFFRLAENTEWGDVETRFAEFPFTKALLKTEMSDTGYASFMFPGDDNDTSVLESSTKKLTGSVFDYASLHVQEGASADINLSLFEGGDWVLPEILSRPDDLESTESAYVGLHILPCRGRMRGLQRKDFAVASELRSDIRAAPAAISQSLRIKGWDIDPKQVAYSTRKMIEHGILEPDVVFGGLGLSTNFCFEIVCSPSWKRRLVSLMPQMPAAMSYLSPRGVVVWIQVPSQHQVEYYQFFRSLERRRGVESVLPIMTLAQKGSRAMLDLVRHWHLEGDFWYVEPDELNLAAYLQ